ncbi:hypothetical protein CVT26_009166 [Gymnopilus dilepis]|uniref:Sm protein G n=1 Tax=Gymnopilus dilepis TaxID=231916 RepID=A0A409Y9U9_9AGAR|nr:hypothetical protein CVT26_009166 [Gymnopilus dilepis]
MSKASQPELKKFMDKKLFIHLQGGRKVSGVLRGYDLFLNLVIDDAVEETTPAQKHPIGSVVIREMPGRSLQLLNSLTHRSFRQPIRLSSSLSLPPDLVQSTFNSDSLSYAQRASLRDLTSALAGDTSPSDVWSVYTNALSSLGSQSLPLEVHKQVLRRCIPTKNELKARTVARLSMGKWQFEPPSFEPRLQALMSNILALGARPALEDYNYVLERFAAVGYYEGCLNLYEEVKRVGHTPNHATFGYCLQAIAYRLTMPIPSDTRETTVARMQKIFRLLISDMRTYGVPLTGVHVDLTMRILKETLDYEGLEAILRRGYGIDLSHPDRIALEYSERSSSKDDDPLSKPATPFRFTTAALNTTIDILGQLGNVSKLVQAFEVLTQPLPRAGQHFFNSFESDEEDDYGVDVDVSPPSQLWPICARPNTTTYNLLIRHLCHHGHAILARHYLIQARMKHSMIAHKLHNAVISFASQGIPLSRICAPHLAIGRLTFLPVLGESNRDKNLGLMRWLSTKVPSVIEKQKRDLYMFTSLAEYLQLEDSSTSAPVSKPEPNVSDLDVTDPAPPKRPKPKYFDINLHIRILRRNILELEVFNERLSYVLGRTFQRVKERLGRRVWDGKNIYLSTDGDRVFVSKEDWKDIVNFRPKKADYEPPRHGPILIMPPIFRSRLQPTDPRPPGVQRPSSEP